MSEQLSLFDASRNGRGDLLEAIRQRVAEDDMSDHEVEAAVEDALTRRDWIREARRCGCIRPLVLPNVWLHHMTCTKCGRRPREAL